MAAIFTFRNRATLEKIASDLVLAMSDSNPIFQYVFPIKERTALKIRWEVDSDYSGLMKLRGLGGPPTPIETFGKAYFETDAAVFGEFATVDETEMAALSSGIPEEVEIFVSVNERVDELQATLTARQENRMRMMAWKVAMTGALAIPIGANGGIGYKEGYTIPSWTVPIPWSTTATATPIANLQALPMTYGRGTSNSFGRDAVILGNSKTMSYFHLNRNANDWAGKVNQNGAKLQDYGQYEVLRQGLNLPQFITWDGAYYDDTRTLVYDIPDGELLVVAGRAGGEKPGQFQMVRNELSKSPKPYAFVKDYTKGPNGPEVPPRLEVHAGFNGGVALHRPSQLLRLVVA